MDREERTERAIQLREQGLTFQQIAAELGCCYHTVRRDLQAAGVSQPKPGHPGGRKPAMRPQTLDAWLAELTDAQRKDLALRLLTWRQVDANSSRRSL